MKWFLNKKTLIYQTIIVLSIFFFIHVFFFFQIKPTVNCFHCWRKKRIFYGGKAVNELNLQIPFIVVSVNWLQPDLFIQWNLNQVHTPKWLDLIGKWLQIALSDRSLFFLFYSRFLLIRKIFPFLLSTLAKNTQKMMKSKRKKNETMKKYWLLYEKLIFRLHSFIFHILYEREILYGSSDTVRWSLLIWMLKPKSENVILWGAFACGFFFITRSFIHLVNCGDLKWGCRMETAIDNFVEQKHLPGWLNGRGKVHRFIIESLLLYAHSKMTFCYHT